ncbi:MAG: hypothetical protein HOQ43_10780 [Glycomyces artemisiae]|uniref:Uncharacterized protein n=1 Tax=Glycomyces artemisiae TaxID=1076443 RepID=A0A850C3N0_9ACTN|nr:hypothetical protein [Glycomyces artemisiae]
MTRRPCTCRMCVKAIGCDAAGLRTAATVYRSLCLTRRAERRSLYTREAAAAAALAELTSLTPATPGDDTP